MDKDQEEHNDIFFEADSESETNASGEEDLAGKLKKVKQELKSCQAEKAEYLAGWQRAKADYLNLKREEEGRRQTTSQYAKADVLNDLIRLADSFEMAFADKRAWESVPANWRQGVEYIHSQLLVVFRDHGVDEIDPVGEPFDPERHESIGSIPTDKESDDGKILEVIKKGYRLNGKVLRPAQVRVGQYKN